VIKECSHVNQSWGMSLFTFMSYYHMIVPSVTATSLAIVPISTKVLQNQELWSTTSLFYLSFFILFIDFAQGHCLVLTPLQSEPISVFVLYFVFQLEHQMQIMSLSSAFRANALVSCCVHLYSTFFLTLYDTQSI